MKKLVFLVITVIAFSACSNKQKYTIKGSVDDAAYNDKSLIIEHSINNNLAESDTVVIKSNAFKFEGVFDSVVIKNVYSMDMDVMPFVFITEKGNITVDIKNKVAKIGGTPFNDKLQAFNDKFQAVNDKGQALIAEFNKKTADSTATAEDEIELRANLSQLANENTKTMVDFARENADNILGKYCFMTYFFRVTPAIQEEMKSFATPEIKKMMNF